jgi:aminoglycoside phosphotransferase (APT) family kinase protein
MSYLRENAPRYFSEFSNSEVKIKLLDEVRRPQSKIYRFQLEAKNQTRFLRVKVPRYSHETGGPGHAKIDRRPRRFPITDLETKFQLEFAALFNIRKHFEGLDDARFGTVNVLDSLTAFRGSVMEEVNDPSLRSLFVRENRLQKLFTAWSSIEAFRNAGSWLRAYHSLPLKATTRHQQRAEFIDANVRLAEYLSKLTDTQYFRDVAALITRAALEVLPDSLPLGLNHGDYAMRNILVGVHNRVTVLDTLARWRTAVYEDIGYFLTNLKVTWPQVMSQGMVFKQSLIEKYEQIFLLGYFGDDSAPIRAIRLYEIQALLDRWSGRAARSEGQFASGSGAAARLMSTFENRYYRKTLNNLLQSLSGVQKNGQTTNNN